MRAANDQRQDSIVKRELFETHVALRYRILAVFDNRDPVANMWRNGPGLTCFQVTEGHF